MGPKNEDFSQEEKDNWQKIRNKYIDLFNNELSEEEQWILAKAKQILTDITLNVSETESELLYIPDNEFIIDIWDNEMKEIDLDKYHVEI